jgi:HIRAN domain
MGLFTRKVQFSVVALAGEDHCAVHGESFYGEAIGKTLPLCWADEEDYRVFQAFLIPEPDNRYDANAVGVWSSCGQVGHLPREDALLYRPLFDEIRSRGYEGGSCEGVMLGGTPDKPNIGILLRLSQPETCLAELG